MNQKKSYILTESIDEGICRMWHFRAVNKYELAKYIIANRHQLSEMFEGISWQSGLYRWRKSEELTPESLLLAISKTYIDGDSESCFQLHELSEEEGEDKAVEVTWTSEGELEEYL